MRRVVPAPPDVGCGIEDGIGGHGTPRVAIGADRPPPARVCPVTRPRPSSVGLRVPAGATRDRWGHLGSRRGRVEAPRRRSSGRGLPPSRRRGGQAHAGSGRPPVDRAGGGGPPRGRGRGPRRARGGGGARDRRSSRAGDVAGRRHRPHGGHGRQAVAGPVPRRGDGCAPRLVARVSGPRRAAVPRSGARPATSPAPTSSPRPSGRPPWRPSAVCPRATASATATCTWGT